MVGERWNKEREANQVNAVKGAAKVQRVKGSRRLFSGEFGGTQCRKRSKGQLIENAKRKDFQRGEGKKENGMGLKRNVRE